MGFRRLLNAVGLRAGVCALLAASALGLAACSSPDLQHALRSAADQAPAPSPDAQHRIAERLQPEVDARFGRSRHAELESYLRSIARKIGAAADPQGVFSYDAVLLDHEQPMVFSAGDGRIYVTTRLVEVLSTEDQMAFAIGHEVAHVRRGDPLRSFAVEEDAARAMVDVAHRGYASHIEALADREALDYLVEAGYDPRQGPEALNAMRQFQRATDRFGAALHGSAELKSERATILARNVPRRGLRQRIFRRGPPETLYNALRRDLMEARS